MLRFGRRVANKGRTLVVLIWALNPEECNPDHLTGQRADGVWRRVTGEVDRLPLMRNRFVYRSTIAEHVLRTHFAPFVPMLVFDTERMEVNTKSLSENITGRLLFECGLIG